MRFTVTWQAAAEQELAEIWLRSAERNDIVRATDYIDRVLATEPLSQGEEFYGDRILVVLPLAVTFTISEPDRRVQILQVCHPWARADRVAATRCPDVVPGPSNSTISRYLVCECLVLLAASESESR
jgi:hypothetical protein